MAVRLINAINLKKYIQGLDVSLPYNEQDKEDIIKQVCCIIDNWPTLTPPNEPLTLERLREMDGEPVWLDVADGVWALVDANDDCVWLDRGGSININKLAGKVYRRPPERQEDT